MAVCSYGDPAYPGLVAFDYGTGDVLWTSDLEDLGGARHRRIAGVLIAHLSTEAIEDKGVVVAANQLEAVAFDYSGSLLWRSPTSGMALGVDRPGAITSLSYRDDGYLIMTTSRGWVLLVAASDGSVVDACRMHGDPVIAGRRVQGTFVNFKSSVVIGDHLYLMTKFRPDSVDLRSTSHDMIFLVRLAIRRATTARCVGRRPQAAPRLESLDWIEVGVTRLRGGSPSAWQSPAGNVIFVNSDQVVEGRLVPSITALLDDGQAFRKCWRALLPAPMGDAIRGAPAFHPATQTLVAPALSTVFILRNITTFADEPPKVERLTAARLLRIAPTDARVTVTSPGALTYDQDRHQIVMCSGFRIRLSAKAAPYSFLASYAVPVDQPRSSEPLWRYPLAATPTGVPLPGPGTFGQPAMFGLPHGENAERTGIIVNTVRTGTHIIRG